MEMKLIQFCTLALTLVWGLNGCAPKSDGLDAEAQEAQSPKTFTNHIADGAEPRIFKKDGIYYYCGSGDGGIYVTQSEKMTDPGERRTVWKAPEEGWNKMNIWAPELHFIEGKWYIYYAAGEAGP